MPFPTRLLFVALLAVPFPIGAQSREAAPQELFRTVETLDSALFDAYNRCDLEKFASFFTEDVEFYHDQTGLSVGRQNLTESLKKNICGKVRRELVRETLEVYPLKGYGAVEMGVHRFYHPGADDRESPGEAKFIHLWSQKDGQWKITRVISYNHVSLRK
jgi:uncharacterized protein (TIGR02246 family)